MAGGDSAPVGSVPVGSVPVGSVPVGSVPVDKAVLRIGEARLLDRAVSAAAAAETIVVVGPRRPIEVFADRVVWTRERPAGSGPAAGIVHALALVVQSRVVVLAVDAPFTASAVPRLVDALAGEPQVALDGEGDTESAEAAMLVDASGRRQPLIACYATQALRRRAAGEVWTDRSVRALVDGLRVTEVTALGAESLDCDTPEDVEAARAVIGADAARAPGVGVPGVVPGRRCGSQTTTSAGAIPED